MATPTELYINAELPKRPYTAQYPLTAGHVPVATGIGLEISARQLDVTDVANAASEQYVNDAISALVDGAPAALDTLNELAAAINDDENYAATVTTALGNRLRVDVNNQGLTNTEKQNGLDNLGITEVITDASVNASGLITFTKNTGQASDTVQIPTALNDLTFNSTTGVLTLKHTNGIADSTITVASNEIADDVFRVKDNVDGTKKIAFEASGITAATTRTITMPDRNVDLGKIVENVSVNGGIYTIPVGANQRLVCTDESYPISSQTINADALVGTQNICQVVSSGGAPIFIYQNGTAVWKNEQEQTITSFTLYYGESATLMNIAGSVYVLKNGVLNSSFSLLSSNRTTKVNFNLDQLPNSVTRSITMPNVNVNLGNPYIGASFSTSNGYLTLNRVSGVDTYINLNPDPTIVSTNYTLESGKVYALGHPSFGVLDPMTQLVANVTLTLPAPQKAIKIYVGNYKGTITFAGATVYSPEGASIPSFYPTPGSILEFVIGDPGTFIPGFYTWTLFEQQNGIYEAADFKLIKNNNQDFGVTFNLSNITGNKIITMPNASADLGQIPATHTSNGNSVTGSYGAIVNGLTNTASGQYSAVLNGTLNTASGKHGIVISGQSNTAKTDQVIINGRNITGIETTGAVIRGGIVEGVAIASDALGTTVAEYTLRGRVTNGATNWILANVSTNAAMSGAVTTVSSIKATLSTTTNPDIVNACGMHDVTFMIIGSSGSPKPIFAGQRRVMVYYDGTTYTMEPVQTIGTDYTIGGATSTLTIGLTPTAPLGLLTFAVANNEANNVVVNISVRSTYNNYQ